MNLDVFKTQLISQTARRFSWDDQSDDENRAVLTTRFNIADFSRKVMIKIVLEDKGRLSVLFFFPPINMSRDNLKLVNKFNIDAEALKAYFYDDGDDTFFRVRYDNLFCQTIEEACEHTLHAIELLESQDTLRSLEPFLVIMG